MVKKRLFFLVLLLVASTLVTSQDANDNQDPEIVVDEPQLPIAVGEVGQELPPDETPSDVFSENNPPQVISGGPGFQDAIPLEFIPDTVLEPLPEPVQEPAVDNNDEIVIIKKKRKKKVLKTTTEGPYVSCENSPEIIQIRKDQYLNIPEGYTADQCVFSIVNEQCQWDFTCKGTITEAPLIIETTEEPDEPDSVEDDSLEECEPKKKIKFENCFLKIRGLIKKKKPKRCD